MSLVKNLKLILALTGCFILSACSYRGDLVPIPQEGSELLSTMFKNDTLRITHNLIAVQAHGTWRDLNGTTYIRIQISNKTNKSIMIDFNECELTDSYGEKGRFRIVYEKVEKELSAIRSKSATINSAEEKSFAVEFDFIPPGEGEARDFIRPHLGKTVELIFPVTINQEMPIKTNFVFNFRYAKPQ